MSQTIVKRCFTSKVEALSFQTHLKWSHSVQWPPRSNQMKKLKIERILRFWDLIGKIEILKSHFRICYRVRRFFSEVYDSNYSRTLFYKQSRVLTLSHAPKMKSFGSVAVPYQPKEKNENRANFEILKSHPSIRENPCPCWLKKWVEKWQPRLAYDFVRLRNLLEHVYEVFPCYGKTHRASTGVENEYIAIWKKVINLYNSVLFPYDFETNLSWSIIYIYKHVFF